MRNLRSLAIVFALVSGGSCTVQAQTEVTIISPAPIRAAVEKLTPGFEKKSGDTVKGTFGGSAAMKKQFLAGGDFDVVVVQAPYDDMVASGTVVPGSAQVLARLGVALAVKQDSPAPDLSSPESVKKALLAASSIAYPDPAAATAAGLSFQATIEKLGILDQLQPKIKHPAGGGNGVMAAVTKGDAEIGVALLSEIDPATPGLQLVGTLPREISFPSVMVGFVSAHAKNPAAAKAFLDYLSSPEAAEVYKSLRMTAPGE